MYFVLHLKIAVGIPTSNEEKHIDRKGISPASEHGEYPSYLCVFRHLKLEIAVAIPTSNLKKKLSSTRVWHDYRYDLVLKGFINIYNQTSDNYVFKTTTAS